MSIDRCNREIERAKEMLMAGHEDVQGLTMTIADWSEERREIYAEMNKALLSSERMDWATPRQFFRFVSMEFPFELDVCASPENAKCERYFTEEQDGLAQEWCGVCWMNPPYGAASGSATVVCLVPARTDTAWWHRYCTKGEVRFLRGRLTFEGAKSPAPFPSALVIFRPGCGNSIGYQPDLLGGAA